MNAQQQAANAQAMLLVDRRIQRIDRNAPRRRFLHDDARPQQIERQIALEWREAVNKENIEVVRERILNGHRTVPFTPVYNVA